MDTLIRIIGCLALTCALIASPVCLALILAFHRAGDMPLVVMILLCLCLAEFCGIFSHLYNGGEA